MYVYGYGINGPCLVVAVGPFEARPQAEAVLQRGEAFSQYANLNALLLGLCQDLEVRSVDEVQLITPLQLVDCLKAKAEQLASFPNDIVFIEDGEAFAEALKDESPEGQARVAEMRARGVSVKGAINDLLATLWQVGLR